MPPIDDGEEEIDCNPLPSESLSAAGHPDRFPLSPTARLNIEFINKDMLTPGSQLFYQAVPNPGIFFRDLVYAVVDQLYRHDLNNCPQLKLLKFYLEDVESGVPAYVTNDRQTLVSALHLNSNYIAKLMHLDKPSSPNLLPSSVHKSPSMAQLQHEIAGVLTHELVHIFQYDGAGKAPGGLIEGLADLVRLRCGFIPPHWSPMHQLPERWDHGYEKTAFFLSWFEEFWIRQSNMKPDRPLAVLLNLRLMAPLESDEDILAELTGISSDEAWETYQERMEYLLS